MPSITLTARCATHPLTSQLPTRIPFKVRRSTLSVSTFKESGCHALTAKQGEHASNIHPTRPGRARPTIAIPIPPRISPDANTSRGFNSSDKNTTPPNPTRTGTVSWTAAACVCVNPRSDAYHNTYPQPDVTAPDRIAYKTPAARNLHVTHCEQADPARNRHRVDKVGRGVRHRLSRPAAEQRIGAPPHTRRGHQYRADSATELPGRDKPDMPARRAQLTSRPVQSVPACRERAGRRRPS